MPRLRHTHYFRNISNHKGIPIKTIYYYTIVTKDKDNVKNYDIAIVTDYSTISHIKIT